jgi:hypothetical protein
MEEIVGHKWRALSDVQIGSISVLSEKDGTV